MDGTGVFCRIFRGSSLKNQDVTLMDNDDLTELSKEVAEICDYFLRLRNLSCFQFKRVDQSGSSVILANNPALFREFSESGFAGFMASVSVHTRQSSFCFWDEALPEDYLSSLKEQLGIYHGFTILGRQKTFYDCTTFAMAEAHPSPATYYFHILNDLQKFAELFPVKAAHLMRKSSWQSSEILSPQDPDHKRFFLPKRSARLTIEGTAGNYITTYEALCVQLTQEGKSYKEIGSMLSMTPATVKTHLTRLKARTGLTLQELSLQTFHIDPINKKNLS